MEEPQVLTKSVQNRDIPLYTFGNPKLPKVVLLGGMHGDEPEGARVVEDFIFQAKKLESQFKSCVLAIPRYNPDGLEKKERTNGNGVDLNRNFPSKDWSSESKAPRYFPGPHGASEPETQALVKILTTLK